MVFWYKNSFLASVVAIFGSMLGVLGFIYFEESAVIAVALIAAAIALIAWGKKISNDKAFKVWWKQVVDAGLEPRIAEDANLALAIYKKNPQKRTLNKILALNPSAVFIINEHSDKK